MLIQVTAHYLCGLYIATLLSLIILQLSHTVPGIGIIISKWKILKRFFFKVFKHLLSKRDQLILKQGILRKSNGYNPIYSRLAKTPRKNWDGAAGVD